MPNTTHLVINIIEKCNQIHRHSVTILKKATVSVLDHVLSTHPIIMDLNKMLSQYEEVLQEPDRIGKIILDTYREGIELLEQLQIDDSNKDLFIGYIELYCHYYHIQTTDDKQMVAIGKNCNDFNKIFQLAHKIKDTSTYMTVWDKFFTHLLLSPCLKFNQVSAKHLEILTQIVKLKTSELSDDDTFSVDFSRSLLNVDIKELNELPYFLSNLEKNHWVLQINLELGHDKTNQIVDRTACKQLNILKITGELLLKTLRNLCLEFKTDTVKKATHLIQTILSPDTYPSSIFSIPKSKANDIVYAKNALSLLSKIKNFVFKLLGPPKQYKGIYNLQDKITSKPCYEAFALVMTQLACQFNSGERLFLALYKHREQPIVKTVLSKLKQHQFKQYQNIVKMTSLPKSFFNSVEKKHLNEFDLTLSILESKLSSSQCNAQNIQSLIKKTVALINKADQPKYADFFALIRQNTKYFKCLQKQKIFQKIVTIIIQFHLKRSQYYHHDLTIFIDAIHSCSYLLAISFQPNKSTLHPHHLTKHNCLPNLLKSILNSRLQHQDQATVLHECLACFFRPDSLALVTLSISDLNTIQSFLNKVMPSLSPFKHLLSTLQSNFLSYLPSEIMPLVSLIAWEKRRVQVAAIFKTLDMAKPYHQHLIKCCQYLKARVNKQCGDTQSVHQPIESAQLINLIGHLNLKHIKFSSHLSGNNPLSVTRKHCVDTIKVFLKTQLDSKIYLTQNDSVLYGIVFKLANSFGLSHAIKSARSLVQLNFQLNPNYSGVPPKNLGILELDTTPLNITQPSKLNEKINQEKICKHDSSSDTLSLTLPTLTTDNPLKRQFLSTTNEAGSQCYFPKSTTMTQTTELPLKSKALQTELSMDIIAFNEANLVQAKQSLTSLEKQFLEQKKQLQDAKKHYSKFDQLKVKITTNEVIHHTLCEKLADSKTNETKLLTLLSKAQEKIHALTQEIEKLKQPLKPPQQALIIGSIQQNTLNIHPASPQTIRRHVTCVNFCSPRTPLHAQKITFNYRQWQTSIQINWLKIKEIREYFGNLGPNQLFIKGGALRDCFLGCQPNDIDLFIMLPKHKTHQALSKFKPKPAGKAPIVLLRNTPIQKQDLEINYCPDDLYQAYLKNYPLAYCLQDYATESDFTVNTLFLDVYTCHLYDPFAALEQFTHNDLRLYPVRNPNRTYPDAIFFEDPIRLFRAIRLTHQTPLNMPCVSHDFWPKMSSAIQANLHNPAACARIFGEILKLLTRGHAILPALEMLQKLGILVHLIPALSELLKKPSIAFRYFSKYFFEPHGKTLSPKKPIHYFAALLIATTIYHPKKSCTLGMIIDDSPLLVTGRYEHMNKYYNDLCDIFMRFTHYTPRIISKSAEVQKDTADHTFFVALTDMLRKANYIAQAEEI